MERTMVEKGVILEACRAMPLCSSVLREHTVRQWAITVAACADNNSPMRVHVITLPSSGKRKQVMMPLHCIAALPTLLSGGWQIASVPGDKG